MKAEPKVATISWFRNCKGDLKSFFEKRDRLTYPKDKLRHFLVEGDSEDGTYETLKVEVARRPGMFLHKADFNSPHIKAFIHPGRARKLVQNAAYGIRTLLRDSDAEFVLWIESDLDYPPDLIERLLKTGKDFVAPMILIKGTRNFYDTYAFRQGNDPRLKGPGGDPGCFQAGHPYHPAYREDAPFEVDAAGSCLFFNMEVLRRGAHFPPEDMIVGFCRTARERGFRIWVDPSTNVWHPIPEHVLDWSEWKPWHEAKVLMKYQEKVPIDAAAFELGKAYEYAKPLEFAWVAKRLRREPGVATLDFGDASTFPAYCSALGMEVVAAGPESCEQMHKQIVASSGVRYQFAKTLPAKLPFESNSFDQIVSLCSIALIQEDSAAAQELVRVCKPGGKVFLTLPYDHLAFWWDHCNGQAPGRYYYDMQSVFERIVAPTKTAIRDLSFIHYEIPSKGKDPYFSHPNNSGIVALELEKRP